MLLYARTCCCSPAQPDEGPCVGSRERLSVVRTLPLHNPTFSFPTSHQKALFNDISPSYGGGCARLQPARRKPAPNHSPMRSLSERLSSEPYWYIRLEADKRRGAALTCDHGSRGEGEEDWESPHPGPSTAKSAGELRSLQETENTMFSLQRHRCPGGLPELCGSWSQLRVHLASKDPNLR